MSKAAPAFSKSYQKALNRLGRISRANGDNFLSDAAQIALDEAAQRFLMNRDQVMFDVYDFAEDPRDAQV